MNKEEKREAFDQLLERVREPGSSVLCASPGWKLWIDDQLDDPYQSWRHVPEGFHGACSVDEAMALVKEHGPPRFMDLDCDLGEGGRVIDFLKWLEESYPDSPPGWNIHSQNRIAAEAVDSFMRSWRRIAGNNEG